MKIQYDTYWVSVGHLVERAKQIYLRAAQLMEVQNELVKLVGEPRAFDHRTVQHFHDQIAAYYRYILVDGKQAVLPIDGLTHEQRLEGGWRTYWKREVERICESPQAILALLRAVMFPNAALGYAAEDELIAYGKRQYFIGERDNGSYP